ncbi:MAG: leucine-rich repeat domain-containing protein [Candidatus Fimenecus sp.]
MKKRIRNLFILLSATLALTLLCSACSLTGNETTYKENADGYALYRYESTSTQTVFTVPDTYEGQPVTELMAFCLANSEYLKELHIGANIQTIDVWALTNCPVLEKITVSEDNPYFTAVDGILYTKDMTELICYPNGKTPLVTDSTGAVTGGGTVVLPDSVISIRDNAFYMCSNLYSVTFNEGLQRIGNKAFLKCGNLQKIELPNTVTDIGSDAFSYCNAVKALEIPASVQSIGDYAFFSTSSQIEKIIVHKNEESELTLGKDWIPNKKDSIRDKVPVEYVGA